MRVKVPPKFFNNMQNPASNTTTPAPTYLAVVREVPGFRFYLNASGETTKYPANAVKYPSPDAAKNAIAEAKMENPASGVALFNSSYQPSSDSPMVWETQR